LAIGDILDNRVKVTTANTFAESVTGLRPKDEDFIISTSFEREDGFLFCYSLLDGMGGGTSGEKASENAGLAFTEVVEYISRGFTQDTIFEQRKQSWDLCVQLANKSVEYVGIVEGGKSGSTLTSLIVFKSKDGTVAWSDLVHVGDSRMYYSTANGWNLLSEDHSMTGEMVRAGYIKLHEVESTHGSNVLTMSLGSENECKPQIQEISLTKDCIVIICCDGVWGPLHTENGLEVPSLVEGINNIPVLMVQNALDRGSTDNCSLLIAKL